jgi:cardiolipin synthase (CMP-forming)
MFNIPNFLSAFRLVGSLVLMGLVYMEVRSGFAWLLAALLISDWIDGKLAIALKQQTTFGARLDSVADALMYTGLIFGILWLYTEKMLREWPWIAAVVASYALTSIAGYVKFHKLPSYHTRAAKTSWLLVSLSAFALFAFDRLWPLRVAAGFVVLTNLEATAMTFVLSEWHSNVPSVWHAWRIQKKSAIPKSS